MKKNKNLIIVLIIVTILIMYFIFNDSLYIFLLINFLVISYLYILFRNYYLEQKEKEYINKMITIAKNDVLNTTNVLILILNENKIVWTNDIAVQYFPHLQNDRSYNFLIENEVENTIRFNNNVFEILKKGEIYFLIDNTNNFRKQKKLKNIQTIIGLLQIDNLDALESTMNTVEYLEFVSKFKSNLYDFFIKNNIYFQELDDDLFHLNLSNDFMEDSIKNEFKDLNLLIKKFQEKNILVTISLGIAYNYGSISEAGQKAKEALNLAVSRGGSQIVIFDNEQKIYFGGDASSEVGSLRLRSRIIGSTLDRLVEHKEVIYLMTHTNPDYDAIASLVLMEAYFQKNSIKVKIIIDSSSSIEKYDLYKYIDSDKISTDYVLDKTKKNILIVFDTQSRDIVSHPTLIKQITDVIIIDHHQTPKNYFRSNLFSWIEPSASSTTELIVGMIVSNNKKGSIFNKEINDLAIMGILTDTNKFKYRVGYQTLFALMNLVEEGGSITDTWKNTYLTEEIFKKKHKILSNIQFYDNFSLINLDREYDDILLSIIVDSMLEIKGKVVSIIISKINNENRYKVKIRSNGTVNAKKLIEKYGGGGHSMQAAAILNKSDKNKLLELIKNNKGEFK